MELRQRSQRPSEPSDQAASPGRVHRHTSKPRMDYRLNPPPPPPMRSPSTTFHHPHAYVPPQPLAHTASPPMAYNRSYTEPFYPTVPSPRVAPNRYSYSAAGAGAGAATAGGGMVPTQLPLSIRSWPSSNPYKRSSSSSKWAWCATVLLGLLLVLVSISAIYLRSVIQSTHIQLEQAHRRPPPRSNRAAEDPVTLQRRERSNLEQTHHQLQHQLQIQEQEYQTLQGDHQLLRDRLNGLETTRRHVIEVVEVERNQWNHLEEEDKHTMEAFQEEEGTNKREEALWARVDRLTRSIGNESERDALEWFQPQYGNGPYKIEIELSYPHAPPEDHPNPHSWTRVSHWIVIELAPLHLMPHAVYTFLRQVHDGVWNLASLTYKDERKLQFAPQDTTSSKLLYREYSAKYPHAQWTVGYNGVGPDFYISLQDNVQEYGPGDGWHAEGDSCFGKIVEGWDILERIAMIPPYMGGDEEEETLASIYEVKLLQALLIKPREENG